MRKITLEKYKDISLALLEKLKEYIEDEELKRVLRIGIELYFDGEHFYLPKDKSKIWVFARKESDAWSDNGVVCYVCHKDDRKELEYEGEYPMVLIYRDNELAFLCNEPCLLEIENDLIHHVS